MALSRKALSASAAEVVRNFSRYSDAALKQPVIITKNGRARNVLISKEEYERLVSRQQLALRAADTPDEFLPAIEALANAGRK